MQAWWICRYRTDVDILPAVALLLLSAECAAGPQHFWLLRAETLSLQSVMQKCHQHWKLSTCCRIGCGHLEDGIESGHDAELQRGCMHQAACCLQIVCTTQLFALPASISSFRYSCQLICGVRGFEYLLRTLRTRINRATSAVDHKLLESP